jgi:hypothetical protein
VKHRRGLSYETAFLVTDALKRCFARLFAPFNADVRGSYMTIGEILRFKTRRNIWLGFLP